MRPAFLPRADARVSGARNARTTDGAFAAGRSHLDRRAAEAVEPSMARDAVLRIALYFNVAQIKDGVPSLVSS